jgi:hypothetical protein
VDGKTSSVYVDTRRCGEVPRTANEHLEQGLRLLELAGDSKIDRIDRNDFLVAANAQMAAAGVRQMAALTEAQRPKLDPQQVGRLWRIVTTPGTMMAELITQLREFGIGIVDGPPVDQELSAATGR